MSAFSDPELMAQASHAVYEPGTTFSSLTAAGFELDVNGVFFDLENGFYATVWRSDATGELIVSYRGTDPSAQDAYTDLLYAEPQYRSPEFDRLLAYLDTQATIESVHFTGHSLGGALAQYGAYRFLESQQNSTNPPEVTITTFNALGGLAGAENFIENFNQSLIEGITGTHYRIENDGVALLGEGHLGGKVATILVDSSLDPFAAHSMSNFTGIDNNAVPPIDFSTAVLEGNTQYLELENAVMAAQLSSAVTVSLTSENQAFTDLEAAGRLIVGILPALRIASDEELNKLEQTFLPHLPIDLIAFRNEINNDLNASISIGHLEQIGYLAILLGEKMAKEDPAIFFPGTNELSADLKLIAPLLVIWGKNNIHNFGDTISASLREYLESKVNDIFIGALDWLADPLSLNNTVALPHGLYGSMEGETLEGLEEISYALYGYGGADTLVGNSHNDSIFADDGNDVLRGGGGNDILSGEADDDTYYFNYGDGQDTIYDADGNNTIYLQHSSDQTDYSNLNGIELHEVSPFSDIYVQLDPTTNQPINNTRYIFNGSALMISIDGGDGGRITIENFIPDENTFGLQFNDYAEPILPAPSDVFTGTAADEFIDLNYAHVSLEQTWDEVNGGDGHDYIWGSGESDLIYGNAGDDWMHGNNGAPDTFFGGDGNDFIMDASPGTHGYGEAGNDMLSASVGFQFDVGEYAWQSFSAWQALRQYLQPGFATYVTQEGEAEIYHSSVWAGFVPGTYTGTVDTGLSTETPYTLVVEGSTTSSPQSGFHSGSGINDAVDELQFYSHDQLQSDDQLGHVVSWFPIILNANEGWTEEQAAEIAGVTFDGGEGNDLLHGWYTSDTLIGGVGDDYFYSGGDYDEMNGEQGNDFLYGEVEREAFSFRAPNDSVYLYIAA